MKLGVEDRKGTTTIKVGLHFFEGLGRSREKVSSTFLLRPKAVKKSQPDPFFLVHYALARSYETFQDTCTKPGPVSGLQNTVASFDKPGSKMALPHLKLKRWTSKFGLENERGMAEEM